MAQPSASEVLGPGSDRATRVQRLISELRLALSIGLIGGLVLGVREALLTLERNAFVQPARYVFTYLTVPLLLGEAFGVVALLPVAVLLGLCSRRAGTGALLPVHAAWLAGVGVLSIVVPYVVAIHARLAGIGLPLDAGMRALPWALVGGLGLVGGVVVGAAGAAYTPQLERLRRPAARAVVIVTLLCSWPLVHFVATDWKWRTAVTAAPAASGPNVVLISIDTLRADVPTPHIDRLAREGVRFQQAITAAPWTLPAMASLLTGRNPSHHGAGAITNRRDPLGRSPLPPGSWTLATELHALGYRTHAVVTNPYLALQYGFGEGFDTYENLTIASEFFLAGAETTMVRLLTWLRPDVALGDRGDTVSRHAVQWLTRAGAGGSPFFLWLHYIDAHPPYSDVGVNRHKSFRGDSLLADASAATGDDFALTSPDVARLRSGEIRLDAAQKMLVRELYRREVASVDAAVGTVLDTLDTLELLDTTLVVCVADHGEEFWEHGGVEHGHTVYDELVRVPLLMRWPNHLPSGAVVNPVVRLVDVAPTVLDILSLPRQPAADGMTLLPLIRGEAEAPRVAVVENMLFAEERVGLRTSDRKYVRWENGKEELYDLGADPREQRDMAGTDALLTPLRALWSEVEPGLAGGAVAVAVPGDIQGLRALGYVQ